MRRQSVDAPVRTPSVRNRECHDSGDAAAAVANSNRRSVLECQSCRRVTTCHIAAQWCATEIDHHSLRATQGTRQKSSFVLVYYRRLYSPSSRQLLLIVTQQISRYWLGRPSYIKLNCFSFGSTRARISRETVADNLFDREKTVRLRQTRSFYSGHDDRSPETVRVLVLLYVGCRDSSP